MNLTSTEKELLTGIQERLRQGDIKLISEKTGFSREHVSRVLSINYDVFDKDIVETAVEIINKRQQDTEKLLKKIL
jgi:NACalpha-BTF3-like transcription factor